MGTCLRAKTESQFTDCAAETKPEKQRDRRGMTNLDTKNNIV